MSVAGLEPAILPFSLKALLEKLYKKYVLVISGVPVRGAGQYIYNRFQIIPSCPTFIFSSVFSDQCTRARR